MANTMYPLGLEKFLDGEMGDLTTVVVKLMAVKTGGTYSAAHDYMNDVEANRYVGTTDQTLSNKTVASGVFDNTVDITYSSLAVDGVNDIIAFILYVDTAGASSTDPLIAWIDTDGGGPISITPNGGDVIFSPNASGIFSL